MLDCTICYAPLRPPVFQCVVGHVVCSHCCAKLAGGNCHICGAAAGFSRCFAVEHILESVKVPCANAGRGCPAKTAYHCKEEHEKTCRHTETKTGPEIAEFVSEEGGNRGRGVLVGLVLASSISVAIAVVRGIIRHFSV